MGEGISFALGYGEPAAGAIADAFARADFSFDTYAERLKEHPLFVQLRLRVRLARFVYLMNYPWIVSAGWSLMRWFMRFTRWSDRDYVPTRLPDLRLTDAASQS
jgi:hypothetical protein